MNELLVFAYKITELYKTLCQKLAFMLPEYLVYWYTIRVLAKITAEEITDKTIDEITIDNILNSNIMMNLSKLDYP